MQYRERLFDILSTNVDEVFMIYNQEHDMLEYISANCQRVLGMNETAILENNDILMQHVIEEDRAALEKFCQRTGSADKKVLKSV